MRILIIDGNNIAHRAFHSMKNLSFAGRGTGAIFGFLNILGGNVSKFKPDKIFVCWDDGRNKHRIKLLPTYKKREPKLDMDYESFHKQKRTIQKLCHYLGIAQCIGENKEADDFIYKLVKKYTKKPKNRIVIASGDKDFRQLVTNKVLINDETKGLITPLNFKKLFIIKPEQYSSYLALMGDSSDKIPGIGGCGEKTALKIVSDSKLLPCLPTVKAEIYLRNMKLIDLKRFDEEFGPFDFYWYHNKKEPKIEVKMYKALCAKYGIKKFTTKEYLAKIV